MKVVCKRAALMRERFPHSSSTNKHGPTDKKFLFVNKTGERFRSKLARLSVGKCWSAIQKVCIIEQDFPEDRSLF